MSETNYTPVPDGYHNARIVYAKRAEKHFGKDIIGHKVFELRIVATDTEIENPAAYKAEFPVVLIPSLPWDFYNEKINHGEWRNTTAADTKAAFENAQKCFPAWKDYCDGLPEGSEEAAFAWFANPELTKDVVIRAKFVNGGTYTGTDGLEHPDLKAKIVPQFEARPVLAKDEAAAVSKALKAAGVKLFGGAKKPTKPTAATVAAPKKPTPPPTPKKSIEKLMDDAFTAYQEAHSEDETGAKYYDTIADILKKPKETWESWTVDEWEQIIRDLTIPF